ncbi:P9 [Mulberry crinivirus]|nr:p9 protein [Mulberry crinivirus]WBP49979.1 P9 [Mulberry crinivirus]
MDLQKLIDEVGLENVERYLKIYIEGIVHPKSSTEFLLNLINSHFLKFDATREETKVQYSELRDFLLCFCFFKSCYRIF